MSCVVVHRCRGRHLPVADSASSDCAEDVIEKRPTDDRSRREVWNCRDAAIGDPSVSKPGPSVKGEISVSVGGSTGSSASNGEAGLDENESQLSPPITAWAEYWPRSQCNLWMRGMLWSLGKSRSSIGIATSMAAKRHSSHLTNVSSSTQEMRNWSVSALTRIT